MRAVIQRVAEAKVTIAGAVKGAIQQGLVVLLAVEEADTAEDIEWLSGKIARLRVFDDEAGVMNRSVQEVAGRHSAGQPVHALRQHQEGQSPLLQPVGPARDRGAALREVHRAARAGFGTSHPDRRVWRPHAREPRERWAGDHHH